MLRIVMDSAGDLPKEWIKKFNIDVIPINVHLGDQVFLEGVNLGAEQFYKWVEETGTIPKTSQPSPQQMADFYRKIAQPGDVILSIHVSSKLSGTYESAVLAAKELEGESFEVVPFDSLAGTAIVGYICREAREMIQQGALMENIMARMENIRKKTQILFTVDNLNFAYMSGRVKKIDSLLASALKIKPIITLKEGTLAIANKVRTRKASLDFILKEMSRRMGGSLINAAIMHANDLATALELSERVEEFLNIKDIFIEDVSVAIATHMGPGTVGIVAYPVEEGVS